MNATQFVLGLVLGLFAAAWLASLCVGLVILAIAIKGRFEQ